MASGIAGLVGSLGGGSLGQVLVEVALDPAKALSGMQEVMGESDKLDAQLSSLGPTGSAAMDEIGASASVAGAAVATAGEEGAAGMQGLTAASGEAAVAEDAAAASGTALGGVMDTILSPILLVVGAVAAMGFGLKESFDAAKQEQTILTQLNSVIKNTGLASKISADGVIQMSHALGMQTGISQDAIASAATFLLRNKAIASQAAKNSGALTDYTKTALDLAVGISQATGSSVNLGNAAKLVSKAVSNPTAALSLLARQGVYVSTTQKQMISDLVASGNTGQATADVMNILNGSFKGAAVAAGNTLHGALGKLGNAIHPLLVTIGHGMVTAVTSLVNGLATLIGSFSAGSHAAGQVGGAVSLLKLEFNTLMTPVRAVIGLVQELWQHIQPGVSYILQVVEAVGSRLIPVFSVLVRWIGDIAVPVFKLLGTVIGTVGKAILDFAGRVIMDVANTIVMSINAVIHGINALIDAKNFLTGSNTATIATIDHITIATNNSTDATSGNTDAINANTGAQKHNQKEIKQTSWQATKAGSAFQKWATDTTTAADQSISSLGGIAKQTKKTSHTFLTDSNQMLAAAKQAAAGMRQLAQQDWVPEKYKQWLTTIGPAAVANFEGLTHKQQQSAVNDWKGTQKQADDYNKAVNSMHPTVKTDTSQAQNNINTLNSSWQWLQNNPSILLSVHTNYSSSGTPPKGNAAGGVIPHMAAGGITQGPAYLVGEGSSLTFAGRGAEAVVPLNDRGIRILAEAVKRGQSGTNSPGMVLNLTVNGFTGDEDKLATLVSSRISKQLRDAGVS